jgi:Protein of unknown function (DUF3577)
MTTSSSDVDFYNLQSTKICGIGFVKQVRKVKPRRGEPFAACTLVALLGPAKSVRHRYYDCEATGKLAERILECKDASDAGRQIMIGFELSNAGLQQFKYRNGEKKDEVGFSEKADLVAIDWLKIDDDLKYRAVPDASEGAAEQPQSASSANAGTAVAATAAAP